eukprot:5132659-Prymnesium_polylepis.1
MTDRGRVPSLSTKGDRESMHCAPICVWEKVLVERIGSRSTMRLRGDRVGEGTDATPTHVKHVWACACDVCTVIRF